MEKNIKHLNIFALCKKNSVKMTSQRAVIADVINNSKDHPDVEKIYKRANKKNNKNKHVTFVEPRPLRPKNPVQLRPVRRPENGKEHSSLRPSHPVTHTV